MLYLAEGAPRNFSIEKFCLNNDVNYNEFYKWYKSMHHGVYQLQIDDTPDNIKATILTAAPSKEYQVNPHVESTHEVYTSGGKQVLMSEEAYELYKHQLDINTKMHQRIHDMEFNDKIKEKHYLCSIIKKYGTRRTFKEDAVLTAVREDGKISIFFNGSILEYEQRSVSFSRPSSSQAG